MTNLTERFSSPYIDREYAGASCWDLRGARSTSVLCRKGKTTYNVRFANGRLMTNDSGGPKSFRTLHAAMAAAIEHAGG